MSLSHDQIVPIFFLRELLFKSEFPGNNAGGEMIFPTAVLKTCCYSMCLRFVLFKAKIQKIFEALKL